MATTAAFTQLVIDEVHMATATCVNYHTVDTTMQ